ncbi:unnamed protein product [Bursaphelenchus okinawaensis]|uniref:ABC transporter domain-containing protein n=1 Tax=Bursaphelenchus okinawaensis TaxID=465554 RepID=A0A811K4W0_9BILA|nr:unnamed protein product [Bursaphelenchus okinawaensis]CAG9091394.1 unnamed protein product [Bursaphelenchus okinawaensis]
MHPFAIQFAYQHTGRVMKKTESTPEEDDDQELDIEPVTVTWENVKVTSKAGRNILNNVSGIALPGETLALMGASGAGKTTLLNTLLQRNLKGLKVTGDILCNGHALKRSVTCISSYIQQEDIFVGTLTVREHLMIQAMLKIPRSTGAQRRKKVDEVLVELGLKDSENSVIGVTGVKKGISGGEAKRLAFAGELLSNPSILFCDEPTTGLDSFMAAQVVTTLHHLARNGMKTIICTIHSPAAEVFEKFDKVMFLAGGQVAYLGPPEGSYGYFASKDGIIIPPNCNAADVIIHRLAVNPAKREESKKIIAKICQNYLNSDTYNDIKAAIDANSTAHPRPLRGKVGAPIFMIMFALWKRCVKDVFRNPGLARAKLVQKVFMGLFLGLLYLNSDINQDGVMSLKGALFYYIAELTYATIFGIQSFVPKAFPLLAREYHDGIYPVWCYYVSVILAYLPLFTLDGIIMVTISYWMMGLQREALHYFKCIMTTVLIQWSAVSIGISISSASPSYAVAVSVAGPLLTVFSMVGGLYTNVAKMHWFVRWIQYLSWFRFGYESLIINQFEDYGDIPCEGIGGKNLTYCEKDGMAVIDNLYFDVQNMWFNEICMALYIVGVYLIGYIGLTIRVILAR